MVFNNFAQFCLKNQNYFTCMFLSQSASFQITSFQTQILQNKKLFKPEQRNKEKSLNHELRILLNPHNYFTNWFSFNKGVGMGQVLLEILWALPWQDLPTTIKHADVKAVATRADFMRSCYCYHYVPWHLKTKYLTQCFCTTVLFQL